MTTTKVVPEVVTGLQNVRTYLEKCGWCQGVNRDILGRSCLGSAIYYGGSNDARIRGALARQLINEGRSASIIEFNDNSMTTFQDVLNLIDRTIVHELGAPQL